jgi:hypothetical protein
MFVSPPMLAYDGTIRAKCGPQINPNGPIWARWGSGPTWYHMSPHGPHGPIWARLDPCALADQPQNAQSSTPLQRCSITQIIRQALLEIFPSVVSTPRGECLNIKCIRAFTHSMYMYISETQNGLHDFSAANAYYKNMSLDQLVT